MLNLRHNMVNGSQKSKGKNSDLCQTLWVSRDEGDEETFFNCRPLTSGTAETPFPYDLNNLFVDPSLLALIFHLDKGFTVNFSAGILVSSLHSKSSFQVLLWNSRIVSFITTFLRNLFTFFIYEETNYGSNFLS